MKKGICFLLFFSLLLISEAAGAVALTVDEAYNLALDKSSVSFIYENRVAWQQNARSLARVKQDEYKNIAVSNMEEIKIKEGYYVTQADNEIQKADIEYRQILQNIKYDVYHLYFAAKNKMLYIDSIQQEYELLKRLKYEEDLKRNLGFNSPSDVDKANAEIQKCGAILDMERANKTRLLQSLSELIGRDIGENEEFTSSLMEVAKPAFLEGNEYNSFQVRTEGLDLSLFNLEFELAGRLYYSNTYYYKLYSNKSQYYQNVYGNLVTSKKNEYLSLLSDQGRAYSDYDTARTDYDFYQKAFGYAKNEYANRALTQSGLLRANYLNSYYLYKREDKKLSVFLAAQYMHALGYQ